MLVINNPSAIATSDFIQLKGEDVLIASKTTCVPTSLSPNLRDGEIRMKRASNGQSRRVRFLKTHSIGQATFLVE